MMAQTLGSFPDVSFIQDGRLLEVEAVDGGCRSFEFSTSPSTSPRLGDDESPFANIPVDDIQETEERFQNVRKYVPLAQQAFAERDMIYPFVISANGSSLEIVPGRRALASQCSKLSGCVGIGPGRAKEFERRAFHALHRLIGGWAVSLGAPRVNRIGPKRAVDRFRELLRAEELGPYARELHARNGDYGLDGLWILGREWGGPVVFFQAKNSSFDREKFAADVLSASDALNEWFGHRIDKLRDVVAVCAVNTVLTLDLKHRAYQACIGGAGFHVLDAVDILFAESRPADYARRRDEAIEF